MFFQLGNKAVAVSPALSQFYARLYGLAMKIGTGGHENSSGLGKFAERFLLAGVVIGGKDFQALKTVLDEVVESIFADVRRMGQDREGAQIFDLLNRLHRGNIFDLDESRFSSAEKIPIKV